MHTPKSISPPKTKYNRMVHKNKNKKLKGESEGLQCLKSTSKSCDIYSVTTTQVSLYLYL